MGKESMANKYGPRRFAHVAAAEQSLAKISHLNTVDEFGNLIHVHNPQDFAGKDPLIGMGDSPEAEVMLPSVNISQSPRLTSLSEDNNK